jgi:hypothetical protein
MRDLKTSEVTNYGKECRQKGYEEGYLRATLDARKRRFLKEKTIRKLSDQYHDYLDDQIAARKKR